jgi:hypothetical protein
MNRFSFMTQEELRKLNSATQYPSIKTYHAIGERGRLLELANVDFDGELPMVTEKIDGVNARIIISPLGEEIIVGSRTELLHYVGDVIYNPAEGIVETLFPYGRQAGTSYPCNTSNIMVVFGEVYGATVSTPGRKQYTSTGKTGFRVFDVAIIPPTILDSSVEQIAAWRDHGGQTFEDTLDIDAVIALSPGWQRVPSLAPYAWLPMSVESTYNWLKYTISASQARLDPEAPGQPEGVIVRTRDRSRIAKIRFEDYERTLGVGRFAKGAKRK